jgi:protein-tyrosine-phosphatase
MSTEVPSTVVFVCPHGALKSRLATAIFNQAPPTGWCAVSAGLQPQEHVSVHAASLLSGTAAAAFLETEPPRPFTPTLGDHLVAIDCEVPGATVWRPAIQEPGPAMGEEIRELVEQLVEQIAA